MVSSTSALPHYHNRHTASKRWEDVRFRDSHMLQGGELNEVQSIIGEKMTNIADALFADGEVLSGAEASMGESPSEDSCLLVIRDGKLYLLGSIYSVSGASIALPVTGKIQVGIKYRYREVTEAQDPELLQPAQGAAYQTAGAARGVSETFWGYEGAEDQNDGREPGEGAFDWKFFPVYLVESGVLVMRAPPEDSAKFLDLVANYDYEANGNYGVTGLQVEHTSTEALSNTHDEFKLGAGRANILGYKQTILSDLRLSYAKDPDTRFSNNEPHTFVDEGGGAAEGFCKLTLNKSPIASVAEVFGTKQVTVELTRGGFAGGTDALPQTSVIAVSLVKQGGTTYTSPSSYVLAGSGISWAGAGAEPAPGSTYEVTFTYTAVVEPVEIGVDYIVIGGLVDGETCFIDYYYNLPRADTLVLRRDGSIVKLRGISVTSDPYPPKASSNEIALAYIFFDWKTKPQVSNVMPMATPQTVLQAMQKRLEDLEFNQAATALKTSASITEPTAKRGIIAEPFLNDNVRDQGLEQTGAIVSGKLVQPVAITAATPNGAANKLVHTLPFNPVEVLRQGRFTAGMPINAFASFAPIPAKLGLSPSVFTWPNRITPWTSPATADMVQASAFRDRVAATLAPPTTVVDVFCPQKEIAFTIDGFGPDEDILEAEFDGVPIEDLRVDEKYVTLDTKVTSLDPSGRALLATSHPNTNFASTVVSNTSIIHVGSSRRTGLLKYTLPGDFAGATVVSAEIVLMRWYGDQWPLTIKRLTQAWTPNQATWNNAATGTPWTTVGGTVTEDGKNSAVQLGAFKLNVFSDITAIAQAWAAGAANHGIQISKAAAEVNTGYQFLWWKVAPRLVIRYRPLGGAGVVNDVRRLSGYFTIPESVPVGLKKVSFKGTGGNSASGVFVAQNTDTSTEDVRAAKLTVTTKPNPLAQTFRLTESCMLSGLSLKFSAKGDGTRPVVVQIRTVNVGVPTDQILGEGVIDMRTVTVNNTVWPWTYCSFTVPISVQADTEYAIVLLTDDATHAVGIARLGEFARADRNDQQDYGVVTAQAAAGVLLTSSNGSTYQDRQNEDLAFKLHRCSFLQTSLTVNLGQAAGTNVTDMQVKAIVERPSSQADVKFNITQVGAAVQHVAEQGQTISLSAGVTDNFKLEAVLTGTEKFSPVVFSDTLLLLGTVANSCDYYTRAAECAVAFDATVVFKAIIPGASSVTPKMEKAANDDPTNGEGEYISSFQGMTIQGAPKLVEDGYYEYIYKVSNLRGVSLSRHTRCKLEIAASPSARVSVKDLQIVIKDHVA